MSGVVLPAGRPGCRLGATDDPLSGQERFAAARSSPRVGAGRAGAP
jgi:hypothetical protein